MFSLESLEVGDDRREAHVGSPWGLWELVGLDKARGSGVSPGDMRGDVLHWVWPLFLPGNVRLLIYQHTG